MGPSKRRKRRDRRRHERRKKLTLGDPLKLCKLILKTYLPMIFIYDFIVLTYLFMYLYIIIKVF